MGVLLLGILDDVGGCTAGHHISTYSKFLKIEVHKKVSV